MEIGAGANVWAVFPRGRLGDVQTTEAATLAGHWAFLGNDESWRW